MNSKIEIQYLDKNFPEIQNQYLDSSLISSDIGWNPKISIEEGLKKSIDFYKKYFN
jgi:CDP-glucose 4,6-dehydratase